MSKRFIDTSTLPIAWRKLDPSLKLTWYYLWNNCDASGVWEIDEDLFEFDNGFEFDANGIIEALPDQFERRDNLILFKNYILVNYVELKDNYNPHKPAFRAINKNNLKLNSSLNQASFKLVDEDKEEDVKEDEEENKKRKPKKIKKENTEVIYPFDNENFRTQWKHWKVYKDEELKFKYKSIQSEQASLSELANISKGDEKTAIAIMHQSMANGWKGFFELKNKANTINKGFEADDDYHKKVYESDIANTWNK